MRKRKRGQTEQKKADVSDVSVNLYIIFNQKYRQTDRFYLERHHLLDLGNGLTGVETLGTCP
jgi:Holliday junction resolvase